VEDAANPRFVAAHVRYVSARSRAEADQFAALMVRWAWPAGHDDRFDPIALEWVRRWAPRNVGAALAECACGDGRCTVCN
jgi:hypothetical protein